jgi:aspartyl-tRNA(Asn)/glutamyl-tRNA(Gln) amidotransferase subunit A
MGGATSPADVGAIEIVERIRRGEWTAVEVTAACLARIDALDAGIRAWAHLDADGALAAARRLDDEMAAGHPVGALHGVPIGIKDIIDVAGMPTTAGAPAFAHTQPTRDATLVARLRAAGAVIVGKTHATQFAYRDPAQTRNPWSSEHTPGGSSSGSAAAVAARMVPAAIGTQTVGSILRPAAYCGVVGLKGAFGAVPLDGVVPLARSLDHGGPIARSVADTALLEGVLMGGPVEIAAVEAPRLGVIRASVDRAEPSLRRHLDQLLDRMAAAGARVVDIELPPPFTALLDAGQVILEAGAAETHSTMFAAHGDGYGPTIRDLVLAGQRRSPDERRQAETVRLAARDALAPLFLDHDALVAPVAPSSAPALADGTGDGSFCAPWSTIGVPAISVPSGLDAAGLPLAVQLVGGVDGLSRLLGVAAWCERAISFDARPALYAPPRVPPPRRSGR